MNELARVVEALLFSNSDRIQREHLADSANMIVGAINGPTFTGGLELALAAQQVEVAGADVGVGRTVLGIDQRDRAIDGDG